MRKPKPILTTDQEYCRQALSFWVGGDHHLPTVRTFGVGIEINYAGDLSTFDMDKLTHLVLVAHRFCVRIEIGSSGPRLVKIIAHRRDPNSTSLYKRHPNLTELSGDIDIARKWQALEDVK